MRPWVFTALCAPAIAAAGRWGSAARSPSWTKLVSQRLLEERMYSLYRYVYYVLVDYIQQVMQEDCTVYTMWYFTDSWVQHGGNIKLLTYTVHYNGLILGRAVLRWMRLCTREESINQLVDGQIINQHLFKLLINHKSNILNRNARIHRFKIWISSGFLSLLCRAYLNALKLCLLPW